MYCLIHPEGGIIDNPDSRWGYLMQIFLLVSLLIAALAVVFALQNTEMITVNFLFWSFQGSLALVLLTALATGAVASSFASLPSLFKANWTIGSQKKVIEELEGRIAELTPQIEPQKPETKVEPDQKPPGPDSAGEKG
ncbi:MAG: LapA family protein [Bacteroidota bacterium]